MWFFTFQPRLRTTVFDLPRLRTTDTATQNYLFVRLPRLRTTDLAKNRGSELPIYRTAATQNYLSCKGIATQNYRFARLRTTDFIHF